ncbi:hypothetical protein [Actinomycetospora aeridis]|uniref:DUF4352 domain-containing protein n=1 Tax=Actinomycetospora aeridis TaxID=3129231 RepID=A0ABU8NAV1_9PSEU
MTVVQPPRHRAADASLEPPTMPIPRAALDAAHMRPQQAPVPMTPMAPPAGMAPAAPMAPMAPMSAPRNGLGIAGLVLGLSGLVVGLIPLFGMGALLLGIVGLVLGLVGVTRARRGAATNTKTAVTGVVACVLAVALGITGMVIVANAFTQLNEDLSAVGAGTPPVAAPAPATTAVAFGQTFTYADGLAVTVSEPTSYEPSSYAAGNTNPYAYSVTVRVTNNTGTAFDPVLLQTAMSTGGAPASQIFDAETGTPPQNQLQPGRSMTYEVAFSTTTNSGEAQVDVTPSFDHEAAVFTGDL